MNLMHSIPVQNPQADHCRLQEVGTYCQESRRLDQWVPELVLQERWRAQPRIHEQKIGSFTASHTLDPMLLVQGWPGVAGLSWLTSRNKGPPPLSVNRSEWSLQNLFCAKAMNRKFPFRPHLHIVGKTRPKHLFGALTETCPHPGLNLEYLWTGML